MNIVWLRAIAASGGRYTLDASPVVSKPRLMMRPSIFLLVALLLSASAHAVTELPSVQRQLAPLPPNQALLLAPIDSAKALAEDAIAQAGDKPLPLRYALIAKVAIDPVRDQGKNLSGAWIDLGDGHSLWRLDINAGNARSVDLSFARFSLPQGAALYLADAGGAQVLGPWTDADNPRSGEFWTPLIEGARARLELLVPTALKPFVELELATVQQGYRDLFGAAGGLAKAGSCNIDAVCPQGAAIRDQIRGAARMTFSGSLCSGQLLQNTLGDRRRLFSTANHCISGAAAAASLVLYWRYESPQCRPLGSPENAQVIPLAGNSIVQTGGASLLATHQPSDFTLLELSTPIPSAADPYWNGWDRSANVATSAFAVHHPRGHEKRISFDFDPLQRIDLATPGVPGNLHWRVVDWDAGTTEPGSSGSGLFNPQRRLIGVLSGGGAACGNELDDYFGRLETAWAGGGAPASRLADALDPNASGVIAIDGSSSCNAPNATLEVPATAAAGNAVTWRVSASGNAPFRIEWDIDGDGVIDRTQSNISSSATLAAQYPGAGNINGVVRVIDASGCATQTQRAVSILSSDLRAAAAGGPTQVCGDGDNAIEPGERWRLPISLTNQAGSLPVSDGIAAFGRVLRPSGTLSDTFGNLAVDSTGGACAFQAIPISAGVLPLPLSNSDDGRALNALPLGPNGLDLYGTRVTQLVMSTNGYLSTGPADSGGNWQNVCGLSAPSQGSVGARLNVLHDDLVVRASAAAGLYREYFASCPRALFAGAAAEGCTVFSWREMARFSQAGGEGNFTFQALVYDRSGAIVYQYLSADPLAGGSATIGLQNAAVTANLEYGCNRSASAPANRAVCIYAPGAQPPALRPADFSLANPTVALPSLAAGASVNAAIEFELDRNAACGAALGVRYLGMVEAARSSLAGATTLFSTTVGGGAACQVSTACPARPSPSALPRGLYTNFARDGNAINVAEINRAGARPVFFGQWYTGSVDRSPTWLTLQGEFNDRRIGNQAEVSIFRFLQNPATGVATGSPVGSAVVSYASPEVMVLTGSVDGQPFAEREALRFARPPSRRIGPWGGRDEPGSAAWGIAIDDSFAASGLELTFVQYIFNAGGQPLWTLGTVRSGNPVSALQYTVQTHCPYCARLPDWLNTGQLVGNLSINFAEPPISATWSTALTLPASVGGGSWTRSNIALLNLFDVFSSPTPAAAPDSTDGGPQ